MRWFFIPLSLLVSTPAWASTPDRAYAETMAAELRKDAPFRKAIAGSLARLDEALSLANRLRAAADESHAKLADALARDWAETALAQKEAYLLGEACAKIAREITTKQEETERLRTLYQELTLEGERLRHEIARAKKESDAPLAKEPKAKGEGKPRPRAKRGER